MSATTPPKSVPAVENAVKLLRRMALTSTAEGVAPMARATGLSVSTTFNILKTLTKEGIVTFEAKDKTYRIGMGILEIVAPILGANPNDLIRPLLHNLAREHSVMIALWHVTENQRIVLIDSVTPSKIVHARMETGSRLPAMIGAVGRVFAARLNVSEAKAKAEYAKLQWQAAPGFESFWRDIQEARDTGYAFDFGNLFIGLNIAAAIVSDANGHPRLGLSAITIAGQTDVETLKDAAIGLKDAARLIETNVFASAQGAPKEA